MSQHGLKVFRPFKLPETAYVLTVASLVAIGALLMHACILDLTFDAIDWQEAFDMLVEDDVILPYLFKNFVKSCDWSTRKSLTRNTISHGRVTPGPNI